MKFKLLVLDRRNDELTTWDSSKIDAILEELIKDGAALEDLEISLDYSQCLE